MLIGLIPVVVGMAATHKLKLRPKAAIIAPKRRRRNKQLPQGPGTRLLSISKPVLSGKKALPLTEPQQQAIQARGGGSGGGDGGRGGDGEDRGGDGKALRCERSYFC